MSTVAPALHTAVLAPLAGIAFAVFCADIALRTSGRLLKQLAAVLMSLAVSTGFILGVSLEPSAGSALAALLAGVALVLAGRWFAHTGSVVFGGLTLLCAMSVGYRPLIDLAQNANWIAMALVGAAAIGLGSLIERHGVALRLNIERWTGKVRERVHC